MEYRIENGKVIAILDQSEVEELLLGLTWSDAEGQIVDGQAWDELDTKLREALKEL